MSFRTFSKQRWTLLPGDPTERAEGLEQECLETPKAQVMAFPFSHGPDSYPERGQG